MVVGLGLKAGPVQVTLIVLVEQQILQPGAAGIHESPILSDVLFLHHADFLVQSAAQIVGIKGPQIHIVVHGLLFRGGDDAGIQHGEQIRLLEIAGPANAVHGMAVVGDGRPPGHNFGVAAHQALCLNALLHFQQIRISVEVVKVLQQRKVQRLDHIGVRFPLSQDRGQVHRQLFVGDGGLQLGLVGRLQVGKLMLLLLLLPPGHRQFPAQIVVRTVAVELMTEPYRLVLGPGHQYDANFGIGIGLVLAVSFGVQAFPALELPRFPGRLFFKRIHTLFLPVVFSSVL